MFRMVFVGDTDAIGMRKIRKVTTYVCTRCYALFPASSLARDHYAKAHPPGAEKKRGLSTYRKRPSQAGRVLDAIRGGARDAAAIAKSTKIPLTRVHSLLSYHRRKGNVKGYTGALRAA